MRIGSLFSGYGGLDLAALQLFPGSSVAWHCEWDDAPAKILDHHWPTVPNHRDVTTLDWITVEPVDILTGGYPCQPFSAAGQRKGTDDERHLWPYVRDAIRLLRPRFTLLENVAGHRSLGFDRVLGDLAEDGMHVRWTSLRASDIGAPHHRERLFIMVTDLASSRPESIDGFTGCSSACGSRDGESRGSDRGTPPNTDSGECDRNERTQGREALGREITPGSGVGFPADTEGERLGGLRCGGQSTVAGSGRGVALLPDADSLGRRQGQGQPGAGEAEKSAAFGGVSALYDWGTYGPAVRRWERVTRPAPAPTELNSNNKPRLNAAFAEWMMGLPAGHVTAVPGISRAHQLKAIGNGVCPQQAVAAYSSLLGLGVAA
ncbi:DNA cytosine methyltransferase [Rhodococcus qingshengii]|uniref:DNA cytosine methyltransferase n=1 Tax=Rhodococcus qingshengii TaxID=334542 RepID=UPI0022B4B9DA|nr:DNA cytosine methyltransferase [Rhodococcus qingshengii]MCZ4613327.1 DNA cytosine methyltransferase [Rhodococcus qingshengii]